MEEKFRLEKLKKIIEKGIDPYPSISYRSHATKDVKENFARLFKNQSKVILAGRLRTIRIHGKASFAHLEDIEGRLQIYLKEDLLKEKYQIFKDLIDIGDFLEVKGKLFITKKGEKTLIVEDFSLLAKTLLPLPEKWHGLTDIETRFRKRYLDLLSNPEAKQVFLLRSKLVKLIRDFFDKEGFIEIETPILQSIPGGANARPFETYHQSLDQNFYLRIAPELYLKRAIVGGLEKVYEVARCFRNEGIDAFHNPEFTQVEFYQAYSDYQKLMEFVEKLFAFLIENIKSDLSKPPYPRISFSQALIKYASFDLKKYSRREALSTQAKNLGLEIERSWPYAKILDEIYKELVRPKIIEPTFLIDHPAILSPLAKRKKDGSNYVERFQLIINGLEIVNGFSELNDPQEQEKRFQEEEEARKIGDKEAQRLDLDFIETLKYGLPPTAGAGLGIDRLTLILTKEHNIREVILFPTLKKIKNKK